jgi:hypothetical protein
MYFCDDVDLMVWEPGIFGEAAFGHQALVKGAAGTLTGTALVMGTQVLGTVAPGMVMIVDGGGISQLMEVTAVTDGSHATVSALRGRADEAAVAGLIGGAVTVTVMSFRPQIAAVGDELLAAVGVVSERGNDGAVESPRGFRMASVFGVLAAVFRVLAGKEGASATTTAKREFYEKEYAAVRRGVRGCVEGRVVRAGVAAMARE